MKQCLNCGYQNANDAERCEGCGWAVPRVHPYARLGRWLNLGFGWLMPVLTVAQAVSCVVAGKSTSEGSEELIGATLAFNSFRFYAVSMAVCFILFWFGDCLKRSY